MDFHDHSEGISLAIVLLNREIHLAAMAGCKLTVTVGEGRTLSTREQPSAEHSPYVEVSVMRPLVRSSEPTPAESIEQIDLYIKSMQASNVKGEEMSISDFAGLVVWWQRLRASGFGFTWENVAHQRAAALLLEDLKYFESGRPDLLRAIASCIESLLPGPGQTLPDGSRLDG